MVPLNSNCTVIVMAKAPVAGYAKTRLIPSLGAEGAAQLAQRLLRHALAQALAAGIGPVELCCAPDARHAAFAELAADARVTLTAQGEGDLGARMARALQRALAAPALQGAPAAPAGALLIGTDAPALDAKALRLARDLLAQHDAVIGPGVRRRLCRSSDCAAWSRRCSRPCPGARRRCVAITRERLRAAGVRHAELPTLHDIDEPADLVHLHGLPWAAFDVQHGTVVPR